MRQIIYKYILRKDYESRSGNLTPTNLKQHLIMKSLILLALMATSSSAFAATSVCLVSGTYTPNGSQPVVQHEIDVDCDGNPTQKKIFAGPNWSPADISVSLKQLIDQGYKIVGASENIWTLSK